MFRRMPIPWRQTSVVSIDVQCTGLKCTEVIPEVAQFTIFGQAKLGIFVAMHYYQRKWNIHNGKTEVVSYNIV